MSSPTGSHLLAAVDSVCDFAKVPAHVEITMFISRAIVDTTGLLTDLCNIIMDYENDCVDKINEFCTAVYTTPDDYYYWIKTIEHVAKSMRTHDEITRKYNDVYTQYLRTFDDFGFIGEEVEDEERYMKKADIPQLIHAIADWLGVPINDEQMTCASWYSMIMNYIVSIDHIQRSPNDIPIPNGELITMRLINGVYILIRALRTDVAADPCRMPVWDCATLSFIPYKILPASVSKNEVTSCWSHSSLRRCLWCVTVLCDVMSQTVPRGKFKTSCSFR